MTLVRWTRFSWDLTKLLPPDTATLPSFHVRAAVGEDERALREVILNVLALDLGWGDGFKRYRAQIEHQLDEAFHQEAVPALVARHGQRIIAGSLLQTEIDAENHLLSGPCVLSEYRNRGIGSALLRASLDFLRAAGLPQVYGVCRQASPTEKFVYRKFGSSGKAYEPEPVSVVTR